MIRQPKVDDWDEPCMQTVNVFGYELPNHDDVFYPCDGDPEWHDQSNVAACIGEERSCSHHVPLYEDSATSGIDGDW